MPNSAFGQKRKLGAYATSLLLLDALSRSLRHSADVAATIVLVDAKNEQAQNFYRRYGFLEVGESTNRMFLPMKTVERVLERG